MTTMTTKSPLSCFWDEKAAYDIDELIALMRCIKANPTYLTQGKADTVWPCLPCQSSSPGRCCLRPVHLF